MHDQGVALQRTHEAHVVLDPNHRGLARHVAHQCGRLQGFRRSMRYTQLGLDLRTVISRTAR